ncbi:hypothetical protein V6Z11_A10G267200 [Gossypium hirsutum]
MVLDPSHGKTRGHLLSPLIPPNSNPLSCKHRSWVSSALTPPPPPWYLTQVTENERTPPLVRYPSPKMVSDDRNRQYGVYVARAQGLCAGVRRRGRGCWRVRRR